jgi:hypothetical protein
MVLNVMVARIVDSVVVMMNLRKKFRTEFEV